MVFSDIKIGHKVVFLHLKKISKINLCKKKRKMERKERKDRNQYLDVPAICRATVSVKLLVMSSRQ